MPAVTQHAPLPQPDIPQVPAVPQLVTPLISPTLSQFFPILPHTSNANVPSSSTSNLGSPNMVNNTGQTTSNPFEDFSRRWNNQQDELPSFDMILYLGRCLL